MNKLTKFTLMAAFALTLILPIPALAKRVEPEEAERLAQRYVQSRRGDERAGRQQRGDVRLRRAETEKHGRRQQKPDGLRRTREQDDALFYVFNISEEDGGGFVIVSGDDVARPVLGYSSNGNFDENNMPPNLAYWLEYLGGQIEYAQDNNLEQGEDVRQEWDNYLSGNFPQPANNAVEPMIQTRWGQEIPYNNLAPMYNGQRSTTGCVATAMAQIMKFYEHPVRGAGWSVAYTTGDGINIPSVDFAATVYDWGNMLNTYTESATTAQQNAVATLMYHAGISVRTDYARVSISYDMRIPSAMVTYFGYDKAIQHQYRSNYSDALWEGMLRTEIDAGLPVFYGGWNNRSGAPGHGFICDGYDNTGKFHFNWGWDGSHNGYFVTTALNPGAETYNDRQMAIINIMPEGLGVVKNVSGVILDRTSVTIPAGAMFSLKHTVLPISATNQNVTWGSSNTAVANVDNNGIVVAVSAGSATITVTTQEGARIANCVVTVYDSDALQYVITGSGTAFTFTATGGTLGAGTTGAIQTVIDAIKTDAAGADCIIQFGNETNTLDIGETRIEFNGGINGTDWGWITITGRITRPGSIIRMSNGVSLISTADLTNTNLSMGRTIDNSSTGMLIINGGTVSHNIFNGSTGSIFITGGIVQGSGNVIANYGGGLVHISGGTVSGGDFSSITSLENGSIIISGGTVRAENAIAVIQRGIGKITISGSALVTSANSLTTPRDLVGLFPGTIALYTSQSAPPSTGYGQLVIDGGTVENTAVNGIGIGVYNPGTITISDGMVSAKDGHAIYIENTDVLTTLTGGLLFARGSNISDVIYSDGPITTTGNSVIMAWNQAAGNTQYTASDNNDIFVSPSTSTAIWNRLDNQGGIAYANGANTGFIPLDVTVQGTVDVLSPDRIIPVNTGEDAAAIVVPAGALTAEFIAGPTPVSRSSGMVNFFWQGRQIDNASLTIFDASGNVVNTISIPSRRGDRPRSPATSESATITNTQDRRLIGTWDLRDTKGRPVSEGTYLVRGIVITLDGKRERVSVVVGVR
ncbi:MAG: C10 family peptidase [Chitinispirillales bacterium]|jgi:uncharacterized protein YjdB|nr:C10 family peptidase [Chitinispirillales bacterium]